jgi:hypothetical protein
VSRHTGVVRHLAINPTLFNTTMKLELACYFPAERPSFIVVEIDSDAYVEKLSVAVYEELKIEGQDVQLQDLYLFKVPLLALLQASN